jgi:hypothetical protein
MDVVDVVIITRVISRLNFESHATTIDSNLLDRRTGPAREQVNLYRRVSYG